MKMPYLFVVTVTNFNIFKLFNLGNPNTSSSFFSKQLNVKQTFKVDRFCWVFNTHTYTKEAFERTRRIGQILKIPGILFQLLCFNINAFSWLQQPPLFLNKKNVYVDRTLIFPILSKILKNFHKFLHAIKIKKNNYWFLLCMMSWCFSFHVYDNCSV